MHYTLAGYGYAEERILRKILGAETGGQRLDEVDLLSRMLLDEHLRPLHERDGGLLDRIARYLQYRPLGVETRRGRAEHTWTPGPAIDGEDGSPLKWPPELLATLRELLPGGPMDGLAFHVATGAKATFDKIRQGLELRVIECSLESDPVGHEHLLIGAYCPTLTKSVRVHDEVAAGVLIALHGEPGEMYRLDVVPRIYRKICQNGMVVYERNARGYRIEPQALAHAREQTALTRHIEQAVRACIKPAVFDAAVKHCCQSARDWITPDGAGFKMLLHRQLSAQVTEAVRRRFRAELDFTRWGLLNAVTAEARAASGALLLRLEGFGGMLADPASPILRVYTADQETGSIDEEVFETQMLSSMFRRRGGDDERMLEEVEREAMPAKAARGSRQAH